MDIQNLKVGNVVAARRMIDVDVEKHEYIKIRSIGTDWGAALDDQDYTWVADTNGIIHYANSLYPIELTVNRMKRFGFKSDPQTETMTLFSERLSVVYDRTDNTLTILKHRRPIFEKYVDYVHELQNILSLFDIEINVTTEKVK